MDFEYPWKKTICFLERYAMNRATEEASELSRSLERAMGIEPTSAAWEAAILPLNHARSGLPYQSYRDFGKSALERFRLPKAISDAQRGAALMELSNQVYARAAVINRATLCRYLVN